MTVHTPSGTYARFGLVPYESPIRLALYCLRADPSFDTYTCISHSDGVWDVECHADLPMF